LTASKLLASFRARGIKLALAGEDLKVQAPAGVITDDLRHALSDHKQALIALLKEEEGPALVPRSPNSQILLSHFQERLWILQQLSPLATEYNIVTAWPLGSTYPAAQYPGAIREVCRNHSILRTHFFEAEDGLAGREVGAEKVEISEFDLSGLGVEEQHANILKEIEGHTERPFSLAEEPPIRFGVFDLGQNGVAVLVSAHHIALDHWSLSLLQNYIKQALKDPSLPQTSPPLDYADYAAWSRAAMDSERLEAHIDWWADHLKGSPDLCSFPTDFVPDLVGRGHSIPFAWDQEMTAGIEALARQEGASVYMCLLAACAVALYGYTGQSDLLLGNSIAVRDRPELEQVIGPFVNTEVLRINVKGDMSFRDVLASAKTAVLDSHPHCHVPFEMVVERLKPARSLNRSPLFQVAVVMQNAGDGQAEPIYGGGAVHDMTWFTHVRDSQLVGSIEYRSDIFAQSSIERVLNSLEETLRHATKNPNLPVAEIPLVSKKDEELLVGFSQGAEVTAHAPLLVESFENVAQSEPDRVAIRTEDRSITYGELNAKANQLAHHLASLGIGAGDLVGLCLERSINLSVVQLGILKSGAAFVPIDPQFPSERVGYLLSDCGAAAILTDRETADGFSFDIGATALIVCEDEPQWTTQQSDNPTVSAAATDRAQVIYTSGSTGAPKGVQITHGAIANLFAGMRREPGLCKDDIVAATTTVSFDISAVELLLPLTVGARIELLSRDVATDGFALAKTLADTGATIVQATPSAWRLLLEAGWQGGDHVRAITGGEPLTRDLADGLLQKVGTLWNGYGPSETTIYSTATYIHPGPDPISIGRPLDNTQVVVLNESQKLTPIGVQGEICIGGAGVAIGYLGRAELTAEKFIDNPYGKGRLYRTGDIGRWTVDGNLMHLGRSDHQVKIRGVRVELGEIEAALLQVPGIKEAAAAVYDTEHDDRRLVAYVSYDWDQDVMASEVRRELRERLPGYMVPSLIVDLPEFPMTPNGKLDRSALPSPFAHQQEDPAFEAPRAGLEEKMAQIWQAVLAVATVGATDNFFEIGGHSLLTLRVAKQLRAQFGIELDPRVMFFQNLRQIAESFSPSSS